MGNSIDILHKWFTGVAGDDEVYPGISIVRWKDYNMARCMFVMDVNLFVVGFGGFGRFEQVGQRWIWWTFDAYEWKVLGNENTDVEGIVFNWCNIHTI